MSKVLRGRKPPGIKSAKAAKPARPAKPIDKAKEAPRAEVVSLSRMMARVHHAAFKALAK